MLRGCGQLPHATQQRALAQRPAASTVQTHRLILTRSATPSRNGASDPLAELLSLHTLQTAPVQHHHHPPPPPQQQQLGPPPDAAHTQTPEQQLERIKKFRGLVNDPLRPYQRAIILHLLFSPDVPEKARKLYGEMKARTLQEIIRARVKAQGELARCLQAASHQQVMLVRWHRNALDKQELSAAAIKQEDAIILRIKTRLGGARSKVQQAMLLAQNQADTDYQQYAAQHLVTIDALDAWLDECRRVYYPWMRSMLRVNGDYARRVAIMGACPDVEQRWRQDMRRVPELVIREVPEMAYEIRYPPHGTVRPALEEDQLLQRIKLVQDDPEPVAADPRLERPPPWALPTPEELRDPAELVLPSMFE